MSYVSVKLDQTACPACGSGRICSVILRKDRLVFCMKCCKVWEPLPVGEAYTTDDEQLAFKVPCDNCAFRGGSQERQQPDDWNDLQQMLAMGGRFYCHKGVPFRAMNMDKDGPPEQRDRGFEFPQLTKNIKAYGEPTYSYKTYDTDRMRLCRGYLNAHIAPLLKKAFTDVET